MSKGPVMVSAEETAKNKAFLEQMAASGAERYIRRHSKQARWTHGITIIACILLCISGLFVFVPALAAAAAMACGSRGLSFRPRSIDAWSLRSFSSRRSAYLFRAA